MDINKLVSRLKSHAYHPLPSKRVMIPKEDGKIRPIDHEWMVKFIEAKIKDPNIIRLVKLFLKAGVMQDGIFVKTEEGTAQGGLCEALHRVG